MNKALKITLIATGTLFAGSILLLAGIIIGRSFGNPVAFWPGNMMVGYTSVDRRAYQPGADNPEDQYGYSNPYGIGAGMMGGQYGHGPSMMGGSYSGGLSNVEPLSLNQAQTAVDGFLADLGDKNLVLGEIMIFENHAYAQILEENTSIGAMEVLVDPITLAVYPEHGPNMMWNLKYGMMNAWGGRGPGMMAGGMMGGYGFRNEWNDPAPEVSTDMPVNQEQAVEIAQGYLDEYQPGLEADEHADQFYGYYTLHILEGDTVVGMLSVNGYTQEAFPHTWHGNFIAMSGE